MKKTTFSFVSEPAQKRYQDLVEYAASQCKYASLVVRHTISLDESGADVLMSLRPYLKDSSERSEWPGTRLLKGTATIYTYDLVSKTIQILKSSTDRLYGWQQPGLPEDLSFLDDAMTPFLFAISHEKESVIYMTESQFADLANSYPFLSKMLRME